VVVALIGATMLIVPVSPTSSNLKPPTRFIVAAA